MGWPQGWPVVYWDDHGQHRPLPGFAPSPLIYFLVFRFNIIASEFIANNKFMFKQCFNKIELASMKE